jgi:hypothetical protein
MKRLLLVLLVTGVSSIAEAHHCREVSSIVGYENCGSFGGWSVGAMLAVEAGASALRYDADQIDATTSVMRDGTWTQYHVHAAPGDGRALTAFGPRVRMLFGLGRTFYLAGQLDVAWVTGGPHLVADISARGTTTTMNAGLSGGVMQGAFAFGAHRRFGAITLAGELAPGARFATYSATGLPDTVRMAFQAGVVVVAQPKLDLWLTPNISLGLAAGFDLTHPGAVAAAIMLGGHLMPYDYAR